MPCRLRLARLTESVFSHWNDSKRSVSLNKPHVGVAIHAAPAREPRILGIHLLGLKLVDATTQCLGSDYSQDPAILTLNLRRVLRGKALCVHTSRTACTIQWGRGHTGGTSWHPRSTCQYQGAHRKKQLLELRLMTGTRMYIYILYYQNSYGFGI